MPRMRAPGRIVRSRMRPSRIMTGPSPTTPRRSHSTPTTPRPSTTAATPIMPRKTMIAPSRTIPKRSGSIRNLFVRIAAAGARITSSEIAAAPLPTIPRRSSSTPSSSRPTPGVAMRTMRGARSTARTPTSTWQSGSKSNPRLAASGRHGYARRLRHASPVRRGGSESRCR